MLSSEEQARRLLFGMLATTAKIIPGFCAKDDTVMQACDHVAQTSKSELVSCLETDQYGYNRYAGQLLTTMRSGLIIVFGMNGEWFAGTNLESVLVKEILDLTMEEIVVVQKLSAALILRITRRVEFHYLTPETETDT